MHPRLVVAALVVCCVACGHQAPYVWADDLPIDPSAPEPYRINAGDELQVRVRNQESLSLDARVRPDGHIRMPLTGDIRLAGLTSSGAADALKQRLTGTVLDPQVVVTVVSTRPSEVTVVGEVKSAGRYPLEDGDSVLDMLAKAGGLTELARPNDIYLQRRAPERMRVRFSYERLREGLGAGVYFTLADGDVVIVE